MSSNDELETRLMSFLNQVSPNKLLDAIRVALNERVHLIEQIGVVQAYNTAVLERARKAEAERDALALRCRDLEARIRLLQNAETIPPPPEDDFDPRGVSLDDALSDWNRLTADCQAEDGYNPYASMNAACAATEAGEFDLESHIVSNLINAEGPVDDDEPTLGDEVLS